MIQQVLLKMWWWWWLLASSAFGREGSRQKFRIPRFTFDSVHEENSLRLLIFEQPELVCMCVFTAQRSRHYGAISSVWRLYYFGISFPSL